VPLVVVVIVVVVVVVVVVLVAAAASSYSFLDSLIARKGTPQPVRRLSGASTKCCRVMLIEEIW